jgi:hypothetical protein
MGMALSKPQCDLINGKNVRTCDILHFPLKQKYLRQPHIEPKNKIQQLSSDAERQNKHKHEQKTLI